MSKHKTPGPLGGHDSDHHPTAATAIRRRMIAGIVTLVPIVVTIWIFALLSEAILALFAPVTRTLWKSIGFDTEVIKIVNIVISWMLAFLFTYLIGLFSSIVFIRRMINLGESLLQRIPIIRHIYGTMKQIVETFSMQQSRELQRVAILEYPRRGSYAMGFITGETEFRDDPRVYVNLFVPTTPNPTSGYLLVLPSEDVREVDLSIEQAFKFIISGGILELKDIPLKPYRADDAAEQVEPMETPGPEPEETR